MAACPDCGTNIVGRRYPIEPLAEFMGASISAVCLQLGISGSTQKPARCHGVTRNIADRAGALLKEHPAVIWPEIIDHDIEDSQTVCAADNCTARFIPVSRRNRFCSARCRRRTEIQRERATPAGRERNRRQAKQWRDSCPDYVRRYKARWWEVNGERVNARKRAQRRGEAA